MTTIRMVTLLVVCGLSACTGGDDLPATTTAIPATTIATTTPPRIDLAESYFEGLGGASDATSPTPQAAAVPGSDAAIFAEHQASARRLLDAAQSRTLVISGGVFELCDSDGVCSRYDSVITDPTNGLVTTFSTDGVGLAGRIVGGGLVSDRDGVVARVSSGYVSVAGDLFVAIDVDNTTDVSVEVFGFGAVYEPADPVDQTAANSAEAAGAWGDETILAGATGDLLLVFAAADLGGHVRLSGWRGDGLELALDVQVPAP